MTMFVTVLLVSVVLGVCVSTALGIALSTIDGQSPARRVVLAAERMAEINEGTPIDTTDPRLPL